MSSIAERTRAPPLRSTHPPADTPVRGAVELGSCVTDAPHTRVRSAMSGDRLPVVLRERHGWHNPIWKNPGDAGMATSVTGRCRRMEGRRAPVAGSVAIPVEKEVRTLRLLGPVWLLASLGTPAPGPAPASPSALRVDWLECREICLPVRRTVTLTIRGEDHEAGREAAFARARQGSGGGIRLEDRRDVECRAQTCSRLHARAGTRIGRTCSSSRRAPAFSSRRPRPV